MATADDRLSEFHDSAGRHLVTSEPAAQTIASRDPGGKPGGWNQSSLDMYNAKYSKSTEGY